MLSDVLSCSLCVTEREHSRHKHTRARTHTHRHFFFSFSTCVSTRCVSSERAYSCACVFLWLVAGSIVLSFSIFVWIYLFVPVLNVRHSNCTAFALLSLWFETRVIFGQAFLPFARTVSRKLNFHLLFDLFFAIFCCSFCLFCCRVRITPTFNIISTWIFHEAIVRLVSYSHFFVSIPSHSLRCVNSRTMQSYFSLWLCLSLRWNSLSLSLSFILNRLKTHCVGLISYHLGGNQLRAKYLIVPLFSLLLIVWTLSFV